MKFVWQAGSTAVILTCLLLLIGCGDTFRPVATPIIQPTGNPSFFDTVGVVQQAGTGINGAVTQLNVSGDTVMSQRTVGSGATMAALDSTGSNIFVPNADSENVTAATANSQTDPTTITLLNGSRPVFAAGTKNGTVFVANGGTTSACPGTGSVDVIDSSKFTLITSICVTSSPSLLVQTASAVKLFAIDTVNNKVSIIDTTAVAVDKVLTVGSQPVAAALSLDQKFLYVLNSGSNDISIIQLADETVLPATIPTGGAGAQSMFMDTHLNRVYVANTGTNTVSVLDASISSTLTPLTAPIPVAAAPIALTALLDGSRVYVLSSNTTVTELSATSFATLKTFTINTAAGATGTAIISSHDASKVYVGTTDPTNTTNGVTIIRTSTDSVVATISSPKLDVTCTANCQLMKPVFIFTRPS